MNHSITLLLARFLLSVIFILAGLNKFGNIAGTADYISSAGLPMAYVLAWSAAIFEVIGGVAILIGYKTRTASWTLAIFCVVSGVLFHNNFGDQTQFILFMKNLGMAGGFLALSISGPGSWSLDKRN